MIDQTEKKSALYHGGLLWVWLCTLTGCTWFHAGVNGPATDGAPRFPKDISRLQEPVPQVEPLSTRGNPPVYTALGKQYKVWKSSAGYRERGKASWYGTKWVGRSTSSGDPYDLYQFTAAHRHLPLPTYARVTHLQSGKSVIVKINDRGPFSRGRIIDLSYAAAARLGIVDQGTADVEVVALDPRTYRRRAAPVVEKPLITHVSHQPSTPREAASPPPSNYWLQVGSFRNADQANKFRTQLAAQYPQFRFAVRPVKAGTQSYFRVETTPVTSRRHAEQLQARLRNIPSIIQTG